MDGDFVLPSAVSKGKVVGAGARTVVSTPRRIGAHDVRIYTWMKSRIRRTSTITRMTMLTNF